MAFFGTYLEVTPHSRLVWTNEEGGEGGPVTTVTFEEKRGKTLLVMHELYSSKEALDAAGTGAADAMVETFAQLDELLVTLARACDGQSTTFVLDLRFLFVIMAKVKRNRGDIWPPAPPWKPFSENENSTAP